MQNKRRGFLMEASERLGLAIASNLAGSSDWYPKSKTVEQAEGRGRAGRPDRAGRRKKTEPAEPSSLCITAKNGIDVPSLVGGLMPRKWHVSYLVELPFGRDLGHSSNVQLSLLMRRLGAGGAGVPRLLPRDRLQQRTLEAGFLLRSLEPEAKSDEPLAQIRMGP